MKFKMERTKYVPLFEQFVQEPNESNCTESFVILIRKNYRNFYATENEELTWMKTNARKFASEEEAKTEIKTNRDLERLIGSNYKIIAYSDAKNY